ncbi:unnamed protein product [Allacma fusca]|uniref:CRAL-TRIO domain-containing protein n=1 Tax=Allacma fusca TaxID=39272 RepID=A0A8J2JSK3_9HEXA|nr:unnamed protein product [Allacma fusca]
MATPSVYELEILPEFRMRIKDLNLNEHLNSNMELLRWIRARNSNLDQAELMFRTHMKWREDVGYDQLLLMELPKQCDELLPETILGFDDDNCPVIMSHVGKWDVTKILEELDPQIVLLSKLKIEKILQETMKDKLTSEGVPVTQYSGIIDLEGLSVSQGTLAVLRILSKHAENLEANFPESSKMCVVINAPWFFPMFYKCAKPFLSEKTKSNIHIYGKNQQEWMDFMKSKFPLHVIPRKYGGSNDIEIP